MMGTSPSPGRDTPRGWAQQEGLPLPLGATWVPDERAYNFAVYSKHAERVTLLAFRDDDLARPAFSLDLDDRHHKSGRVWHCRVPEEALRGARYYAYSIAGPAPGGRLEWHAFDAEKILLDPYANAVFFPPAFDRGAAIAPGPNVGRAPLGVLPRGGTARDGDVQTTSAPRAPVHESDAVIYELHVRNFTRDQSSGVATEKRGTCAGIIEKIPYLVDLGVTIVELMPVFQYDPGAPDRWGYMPLSFFALHHEYLSAPDHAGHREFRGMIDALHRAGIEVVLDVVYNHTCERGSTGPTYSCKGIDNSTYYLMTGDAREPYADYAGTGNTMHCANHAVRKMILDSMRHWVRLGVDGFRFDLASIYARDANGAVRYDDPPIFGEISADPDFARVRLIAEPWDAGAYQLGRSFPG
ncbi:MAG TPA: alpha-amylase family glycosyl hydrolase, partial [Gemmatimonadaceae bacterium]|nr:alpha-amylase family glycosyl hydrolase [Gemmatimonadaceae bacterium]